MHTKATTFSSKCLRCEQMTAQRCWLGQMCFHRHYIPSCTQEYPIVRCSQQSVHSIAIAPIMDQDTLHCLEQKWQADTLLLSPLPMLHSSNCCTELARTHGTTPYTPSITLHGRSIGPHAQSRSLQFRKFPLATNHSCSCKLLSPLVRPLGSLLHNPSRLQQQTQISPVKTLSLCPQVGSCVATTTANNYAVAACFACWRHGIATSTDLHWQGTRLKV